MSERDPLAPAFEIPDLELEPPPSKRAAPARPAAPVSARAGLPQVSLGLAGEDDFDLLESGSSSSLSLSTDPLAPAQHVETVEWPRGRTPGVEQLSVDPREVSLVAGYGPAPTNALLAPAYAYRVLSRRRPLKRALAEHHAALERAELERDNRLMQLAIELRPALEVHEAFKRALDPVRDIERLAGERSTALAQADSGYREQMATFDATLAELRQAESQARARAAEREASARTAEGELRRVEAKHQRVQIEARGVMDMARQRLGPEGGDLPADLAAKLAELQARAASIEPDVAHTKARHAAANAALREAEAEVQGLLGKARQLDRQKASAAARLNAQLSERAAGVGEAEKQLRDALAEVARAVLAARGALPVAGATLAALVQHDQLVAEQAKRHQTHLRALDSYDRERARQGIVLVLSALGVVLLYILLKAVL